MYSVHFELDEAYLYEDDNGLFDYDEAVEIVERYNQQDGGEDNEAY